MSIKPIDFQVSYTNSINEAKVKQNNFNKVKEFNQMVQHQQNVETDKNLKRVLESENTKGKKINSDDENDNNKRRKNRDKEKKKRQGNKPSKDHDPVKSVSGKGSNIDIMI